MLVTIGIPTYNRVDGLRRALESALGQTHTSLEIIVSNDNSPNPAIDALMLDYAARDERIRYIHHPDSLRTVANFSFVKQQARGDYFLFLADDDWLDPDYIEKCVAFLENNPGYTIAAGQCHYHSNFETILHSNSNFGIENAGYWSRIYQFFNTVSLNGFYYGVMRTSLAQQFHLPNQMGFDWSIVAYMCFNGKLKAITTTAIHLSQGGMSNEGSALSSYFDQKGFMSSYLIGLTTACNCARNFFSPGLYDLPIYKKTLLGWMVFVAAYANIATWDLLFLKRRALKFFKLGANGVLFNK